VVVVVPWSSGGAEVNVGGAVVVVVGAVVVVVVSPGNRSIAGRTRPSGRRDESSIPASMASAGAA
jgi:hypothetical protein